MIKSKRHLAMIAKEEKDKAKNALKIISKTDVYKQAKKCLNKKMKAINVNGEGDISLIFTGNNVITIFNPLFDN